VAEFKSQGDAERVAEKLDGSKFQGTVSTHTYTQHTQIDINTFKIRHYKDVLTTHIHTHINIYIHKHIRTHTYIYAHIYIHAHIHTHTYTHTGQSGW
jgi:hypothetical protein